MNRTHHADRLFGMLTFTVLSAGTIAIGAALFDLDRPSPAFSAASARVVQLPAVEVIGRRDAVSVASRATDPVAVAASTVRLPKVTVTGRRAPALVAAASAQKVRVSTDPADCSETTVPTAASATSGHDA